MGAFVDYLDLRLAVADVVQNRGLSDVMARLTKMAEAKLDSELRTRYQITEAPITFTDGEGTLPADFLEMINVYGTSDYPMYSSAIRDFRRLGSQWSRYQINGNTITINGYAGDRDIQYYARIPTLTTSDASTNWLLERYPYVYLYAVALEGALHVQDMTRAEVISSQLENAKQQIRVDDELARYSNGQVRVRGLTP